MATFKSGYSLPRGNANPKYKENLTHYLTSVKCTESDFCKVNKILSKKNTKYTDWLRSIIRSEYEKEFSNNPS